MKKIMTNIFTILICIVGTGQAATFDRGNGLIYDDVLDITWLQNANLSGQTFNWQGAVPRRGLVLCMSPPIYWPSVWYFV